MAVGKSETGPLSRTPDPIPLQQFPSGTNARKCYYWTAKYDVIWYGGPRV
jgi:hypothetical protein